MLIPFKEMFARHKINTPAGVLHIGASTGQEAEAYAALGIKRVVWVEALPDIYAKLVKHTERFPGTTCIQACVSDKDGELRKFNVTDQANGFQSSSLLELGTHAQEHPAVKYTGQIELYTSRVETLLARHGVDVSEGHWFLNIDLQGAELLALRGMESILMAFDWAYLEVNEKELYVGCPLVTDLDKYLAPLGMSRVETKMTRHGWGDALFRRFGHTR